MYYHRLQAAISHYRVTTTELVESVAAWREAASQLDDRLRPRMRRTRSGVWRLALAPYMIQGRNILLMIRDDLDFAPVPHRSDPLLLQWFSEFRQWWAAPGGIPPDMLLPARMHSILELTRMQRAHELSTPLPASTESLAAEG